MITVLATFPVTLIKYLVKATFQKENLFWPTVPGSNPL